jgi:hypothetical protein
MIKINLKIVLLIFLLQGCSNNINSVQNEDVKFFRGSDDSHYCKDITSRHKCNRKKEIILI